MLRELDADAAQTTVHQRLGSLARRFAHADQADVVLRASADGPLAIVTSLGPTTAPTADTLSVMLGIVELQHLLHVPVTVVVSEHGASNSRNVARAQLEAVSDQIYGFLEAIGFDPDGGVLRSHLDFGNLARAGKIARFLDRREVLDHHEGPAEMYAEHRPLGTELGVTVDSLYAVADILGPVEDGAGRVLMVSGLEESHFTKLARVVLARQSAAGDLGLGWNASVGALYFRTLEGLGGHPRMCTSIPASNIHLGMGTQTLTERILSDDEADQPALLSAIELSSGWRDDRLAEARTVYTERAADPDQWRAVRAAFLADFRNFSILWGSCAPRIHATATRW